MTKDAVRETVHKRVSEYEDQDKLQWFEEWFLPTLDAIGLRCIAWEELLTVVSKHNDADGRELEEFYSKCLEFNKSAAKRYAL